MWLSAWWNERHRARERKQQATEELAISRKLLREDQKSVGPLAQAHRRNQFSDIIREALEVGYQPHSALSHGGTQKKAGG
jgi:hypothetical protein